MGADDSPDSTFRGRSIHGTVAELSSAFSAKMLDKSRQFHYISGMDKVVTATEAGRTFLRLLEEVKKGRTITITRYGKPAAVMVPAGDSAKRNAK